MSDVYMKCQYCPANKEALTLLGYIFLLCVFYFKSIYPIVMMIKIRRERKKERDNWK